MAGITANKTKFTWDSYEVADLLSISGPTVTVATIDTTAISITDANPLKASLTMVILVLTLHGNPPLQTITHLRVR